MLSSLIIEAHAMSIKCYSIMPPVSCFSYPQLYACSKVSEL